MGESPGWRHSLAVKLFGVVFLATHVPLLCLIGLVTYRPDLLTPAGVLALATVATLGATSFVFFVMWRFLRPLRAAADGLQAYMKQGTALRLDDRGEDEVAHLVRLLVRALGHLDRARAPLLRSSALQLRSEVQGARVYQGATIHTVILAEVNEWGAIEASRELGAPLHVPTQATGFQLSVVHADCGNEAAGWSAALQRLDQRMFALRAGIKQSV